jgi:hypothetical protein
LTFGTNVQEWGFFVLGFPFLSFCEVLAYEKANGSLGKKKLTLVPMAERNNKNPATLYG